MFERRLVLVALGALLGCGAGAGKTTGTGGGAGTTTGTGGGGAGTTGNAGTNGSAGTGGPVDAGSDVAPIAFEEQVLAIAAEYQAWGRVDDELRWAPGLCRQPLPGVAHQS